MNTSIAPLRTARIAAAFLAIGLLPTLSLQAAPRAATVPPALASQLATLTTVEAKLAFLQSNAGGLRPSQRAALAAAVIQSVPAAQQKAVASQVAHVITPKDADPVKAAGLLVKALPADLAGSLAGSIILGASQTDPSRLAAITGEVISANAATISNAAAIAGEVVAASPIEKASAIASAIGASFIDNPALAQEAPQIAASMVSALLGNVNPQGRSQVSQTVAALTALLPGDINKNQAAITAVGKAVADVISTRDPSLASDIVGVTSTTLKTAAGNVNVDGVLNSFADTFSSTIADATIKNQIATTLTAVKNGTAGIDITPLLSTITNAVKDSGNPSTLPGASTDFGRVPAPGSLFFWSPTKAAVGPLIPPETVITTP